MAIASGQLMTSSKFQNPELNAQCLKNNLVNVQFKGISFNCQYRFKPYNIHPLLKNSTSFLSSILKLLPFMNLHFFTNHQYLNQTYLIHNLQNLSCLQKMQGAKDYDLLMKMIFIGDSGVGKTNLLTRLTEDRFHQQMLSTIGVQFKTKVFEVDGIRVKVQMWDTAGQERFRSISATYYRGSDVIIICYDLTNLSSIQNLDRWLKDFHKYSVEDVQTVLIGCKSDSQGIVPLDIVNQMVQQKGYKHYITSAKTGDGIKDAFKTIITDWTRKKVRESLAIAAESKLKKDVVVGNEQLDKQGKGPKKSCEC